MADEYDYREHVLSVIAQAEEVLYLIARRIAWLREQPDYVPPPEPPPIPTAAELKGKLFDVKPINELHIDTGGHTRMDKRPYTGKEGGGTWWRSNQRSSGTDGES